MWKLSCNPVLLLDNDIIKILLVFVSPDRSTKYKQTLTEQYLWSTPWWFQKHTLYIFNNLFNNENVYQNIETHSFSFLLRFFILSSINKLHAVFTMQHHLYKYCISIAAACSCAFSRREVTLSERLASPLILLLASPLVTSLGPMAGLHSRGE